MSRLLKLIKFFLFEDTNFYQTNQRIENFKNENFLMY